MNAERTAYLNQIQRTLDRLCEAIGGLSNEQLNWRPPVTDANSIFVIATHTLGNAEAWVLGIVCGRPIERDRPAEFRSSGPDAGPIIERARELSHRIDSALRGLPDGALDEQRSPSQQHWGAGDAVSVSVRDALMHVVEHANSHLGHIEVTRDLALAR